MDDDHAVTPGILGLIALLSIGGLLFLGFQASAVGSLVIDSPNNIICCTTETWKNAPIGYTQGNAQTQTLSCYPFQTYASCCYQQVALLSDAPVRVLGVREGPCETTVPEKAYPIWIP